MLRSVLPTVKLLVLVAALLAVALPGSGVTATLDPATVGTWELMVPNQQGVARWVWEIHADGTYTFHSEGPGAVPGHSGTFTASGGRWTLTSATMPWSDGGTYQFPGPDIFAATGKLGTGMWLRSSGTGQAGTPGTDAPLLQIEQIGSQQIPKNLANLVNSATVKAKRWRKDAVLVELGVNFPAHRAGLF